LLAPFGLVPVWVWSGFRGLAGSDLFFDTVKAFEQLGEALEDGHRA